MKILYAVPWIEIETGWAPKDEGFKVFEDLAECRRSTFMSSAQGYYKDGSGYFGPRRPLHYYETTDEIEGPFPKFVEEIKFKGDCIYIN